MRNHVVGAAGVEGADRDHRGLQRIDIARDDALQRSNQLGADQHGIDGQMRIGGVAADAFDPDREVLGRGHDGARPHRERTDRHARPIVHAIDLLDAEAVHQPVLDHRQSARAALFRRLEDHDRRAGKIAGLGEILRGAQQHRGMAVMAAGVHLAGRLRGIREVGLLLDRQRVHIGAQPDHAAGPAATDDADHAGPPQPRRHLVATEGPQPLGDEGRGAVNVVHHLRVGMEVAAPGLDVRLQLGDAGDDGHGISRSGEFTNGLSSTSRASRPIRRLY